MTSSTRRTIVIATPHARYNRLESAVRKGLRAWRVVRFREKEELSVAGLASLKPAYVFFPHWSWIIPAEIYTTFECVIFHMTDVPYGRGGSPLQNLIVRGHDRTMLTALRCSAVVDSGPVYLKRPLALTGTAEQILRRAGTLMASMIATIVRERSEPKPQEGDVVPFRRRKPEDGDLTSLRELREVYDFIRMLDADGYPPAFLATPSLRFEFTKATLNSDAVTASVRITSKR